MKVNEIANLAVNLIEEALEKPNQTIVLEERITKPICEPGIKEPTEQELYENRSYVMDFIRAISKAEMYKGQLLIIECKHAVEYRNASRIVCKDLIQEFKPRV